jgi:hypothetical protein
MVTLEDLRAARYRDPFIPFTLWFKDGTAVHFSDWGPIGFDGENVLFSRPRKLLERVPIADVERIEYTAPLPQSS